MLKPVICGTPKFWIEGCKSENSKASVNHILIPRRKCFYNLQLITSYYWGRYSNGAHVVYLFLNKSFTTPLMFNNILCIVFGAY